VSPVRYELGFIAQKTALFIVTAVKTSTLTQIIVIPSKLLIVFLSPYSHIPGQCLKLVGD
jgi:hypothetical protein